jgi:poly-beta-1,6 N-acetyl-D-glucosamine synthase
MKSNEVTYAIAFTAIIIALVFTSLYVYQYNLKMYSDVSNSFERFTVITGLLLLVTWFARHLFIIWLSFLAHLEEEYKDAPGFTPGVTILVPAYNEGILIAESIKSLLELDYPNYEILIIDDGSTDNTYDVASRFEGDYGNAKVRVVTKKNSGKSNALNVGIEFAEHDFVLCMDGDSKLSPDTLRRGIVHFVDEDVGGVAGNVKVINRDRLWTKLQALEYIEGLNVIKKAQGFLHIVNIVPGAIGLFRKEALMDVGCYDHDTFAEDCDLTLKLVFKGWRVKYDPAAKSFTEAPDTLIDLLKQRYRWTRGIVQTIKKHVGLLFRPRKGLMNTIILWYLIIAGLVWPVIIVGASVFLIISTVMISRAYLLFVWWSQLAVLEMSVAIHAVAMDKEDLRLVPYAIYHTILFVLIINISKTFSTIEELIGFKMTWGKLDRLGKL